MRKTKTQQKKELFLKVFEKNAGNVSATCKGIGIVRETFYQWCEKDEEFKKKVEEVREGLIDYAESMLLKKIKNEDLGAIIFFLKTQGKKRGYSEKQNEINVNVDSKKIDNIQVEFIE